MSGMNLKLTTACVVIGIVFAPLNAAFAAGGSNKGAGKSEGKGTSYTGSKGSLNAINANKNGFLHADDRSRLDPALELFNAAIDAVATAQATYDEALQAFAVFGDFESQFATYADFLTAYTADPTGLDEELAYWTAAIAYATAQDSLAYMQEVEAIAMELAADREDDPDVIADIWAMLEAGL